MHLYLAIFDRSSRHMIAVEGVELTGTVLQSLTFGDFHNMTAAVLQLLHEQNDGKRFCHQAIQGFLIYIVFLHHAVISGFTTVGVGGGDNCVAGTDHLLRGESLSRFHLTDTQCSGCRSEQTPKGTPDRSSVWTHPKTSNSMDDVVEDFSLIVFFHKVKFSPPVFNGEDSLFIGNDGKNPTYQRCFAVSSRTSHTKA